MNGLKGLIERHLKVYLRDRTRIFFSFLSVLMIILVYAVFLGNSTTRSVQNVAGQGVEGIRWLVDSWIMAGILIVSSITVPLSFFGLMIEDKREKKLDGFKSAPVTRRTLVVSYVVSSWFVGMVLCGTAFVASQIYITAFAGEWMQMENIVKAFGVLALSVFSGASITFFLTVWLRSSGAFSSLATIIGTVIGFLTGIYIPLGALPDSVQTVTKLIPAAYAAALMRQVYTDKALGKVFATAPPEAQSRFLANYGIELYMSGKLIPSWVMAAVLLGSGVFFLILAALLLGQKADI